MILRLFLLALLLTPASYALQISEIMYAPNPFKDDYNEWVEIYAETDTNISTLTLCGNQLSSGYIDKNTGHLLNEGQAFLPAGSYAVITDGGSGTEAYENFTIHGFALHINSSQMCANGLSNSGERIYLSSEGALLDEVTYAPIAKPNNSVSRNGSLFSDSLPTPGRENLFPQPPSTQSEQSQSDPSSNQSTNQTTTLIPAQSNACDWKVEILADKETFTPQDNFGFKAKTSKVSGSKTNITMNLEVIDAAGRLIASYSPLKNAEASISKTTAEYHPEVFGSVMVRATIEASCDDALQSNNVVERRFFVEGEPRKVLNSTAETKKPLPQPSNSSEQESSIAIEDLFEKPLRAKIHLYRGNTSKYAVRFYALIDGEKTPENSLHLKDKFSEFELLHTFADNEDSCINNITIILSGLGLEHEETFLLNESCPVKNWSAGLDVALTNKLTADAVLAASPNQNSTKLAAQTKKDFVIIAFLLLSVTLNLVLIWRR